MHNKINHSGIIDSIVGNCVKVRILQTSACAACKVAGHCNAAESKEKIIDVLDVSDTSALRVGDEVTVWASRDVANHALLLGFGVPFLKGKYSDEKGRSTLERAFKLAVRLGAIVVAKNTEVEVVQAASDDASNSHERFITICNQEISKLIVGQTLSSSASPTGELGGGTANLQGEVRDDIRKADAKSLAATFRGQLFDQLLAINGRTGRAPRILFGSESIAEQKATLTLIGKLHEAGLEPDDNALDTISERIGFGIRRAAVPQSPMLPFSANLGAAGFSPLTVPLSAGDSVEDRPAAARADDLTRAFAADLAPIKDIIDASTSPDDCIRRVEDWVSKHNPSNAAEVIEKALYVYSMAGARSAQRPRTRKDGK